MKLRIFILSAILLLYGHASLHAAPSNGTRIPPALKFETGYEYNNMFRSDLARSYGNIRTQDHFFTLSLGLFDWLSLDGKIGVGNLTQKGGIHFPKIEYNTGFAGGYGFRIKAFEYEKLGFQLTVGAQHISVHPQDRNIDENKFSSILDDWQISALASKDIKFVRPYLGIKLSECGLIYKINDHDRKRRFARYHMGLITGAEIFLLKKKLKATIEGRFFDETALSAGISYLF